jgi:hypothetical protein
VNLHPHEAELAAARRRAATPAFVTSYRRWRPMVERSIAWLVAGGHRRVRYRGLARNQQGLSLRVAAINLRRLVTLGWTTTTDGYCLNQAGSGPGVSNEGRLVWRSPSSVTGLHPQTPALRIGHLPGPAYSLRRRSSESALLSSLLAVDQPATSSAASSSMPGTCLREPPCPGH